MAKHLVKKGSTSRIEYLWISDSASAVGAGKTGLAFNTASLTGYYVRRGAAPTSITLATQTVTGAFSSGGFVEVDATNMPGLYRFDPPDAAFATGVNKVIFLLKGASGMAPVVLEYQLVDFDPEDAAALGLTNLDAAVSSRMATFTYTAPLDAAGTRAAVGLASANLDTQLAAAVTITAAAIRTAVGLGSANLDTQLAAAATITAAAIRSALGLAAANLDSQLGAIPTAAGVAGAVWDEAIAGHAGAGSTGEALAAASGTAPTATEIADAVLRRQFDDVDDTGASRDLLACGRMIRNGFAPITGTDLEVLKEDDATVAWTRTLTTDPAAEPIVGVGGP